LEGRPRTAKKRWYSPIETPGDTLAVIRDIAIGFLVVAGLEAVLSFSLFGPVAVSAAVFAVLALLFLGFRSRAAAIGLLVFSVLACVEAVNPAGPASSGNALIALLLVLGGARAVCATFKYWTLLAQGSDGGPA